jgi:hypothetical protein
MSGDCQVTTDKNANRKGKNQFYSLLIYTSIILLVAGPLTEEVEGKQSS